MYHNLVFYFIKKIPQGLGTASGFGHCFTLLREDIALLDLMQGLGWMGSKLA